ncbi:MAG: GlsB/YeaQ/YmgE family stress response membrane protein [Thiothrix sp.]|nr:MAG: GlsB/YeaQ/YmgE family stress response membrane protein [Thiothrix sp.]
MGVVEILIMLAIGAVAGWLAGNLIRGGGFGLIGNIVVGLIGSVIGTFVGGIVSGALNLNIPGIVGAIIWATIGAALLLFIISLFKRA